MVDRALTKPLHSSIGSLVTHTSLIQGGINWRVVVRDEGFEPSQQEPKSCVLPLDESRMLLSIRSVNPAFFPILTAPTELSTSSCRFSLRRGTSNALTRRRANQKDPRCWRPVAFAREPHNVRKLSLGGLPPHQPLQKRLKSTDKTSKLFSSFW